MRYSELMEAMPSSISLSDITAEMVLSSIDDAPKDVQSWMARGRWDTSQGDPNFIAMVEDKVARVKADLMKWVQAPTPLLRGLSRAPKRINGIGVHWTKDESVARNYAKDQFLIKARIRPEHIDWLATVMRRLAWSFEGEFSVIPGTMIDGVITTPDSKRLRIRKKV